MKPRLATLCALVQLVAATALADGKLRALIIDGQNNHDWRSTTPVLKWILEDSGRFTVEISTAPGSAPRQPGAPKTNATPEQIAAHLAAVEKWRAQLEEFNKTSAAQWQQWRPEFHKCDVVIGNYNGEAWPEEVRAAFVEFVRGGGGFVSVHAADNSFPEWPEYNEMIGVGGWGNRSEKNGPMLRFRDGAVVRDETPGAGGTHGAQHEFLVEARVPDHPILRGLPARWMHPADELYAKLRGPARNLTVLATAFAAPDKGGTGENEPMLMAIDFGRGRVFHTTLGHSAKAMAGLGFQLTLARGAEWAATGTVTLPAPDPAALAGEHAVVREPALAGQETEPLMLMLPAPTLKGTPADLPKAPGIEPLSLKPRTPLQVPRGVKNVALGKSLSASSQPFVGELSQITDGKKEASDEDAVEMRKGTQWVQVDLGRTYEIYAIAMWHDHRYIQVMHDVIVQVSDDAAFKSGVTTLFNNDTDNSSGLGVGTDREYFETHFGRVVEAKGIKARYVRGYTKGSSLSALNCWQELEVYARAEN